MKFSTVYLKENKIEIFYSFFSRETIKVNGEIVSRKYSLTGGEHLFSITDNGLISNCKLRMGNGFNGVVFDLYMNNEPIVESPKSDFFSIYNVFMIVGILIGFRLGSALF